MTAIWSSRSCRRLALMAQSNMSSKGIRNHRYSARNILKLAEERKGFIDRVFPLESGRTLAKYMEDRPRCLYAGFDPTADSLHVGNLLVIMALLQAQRSGHEVIALIGEATAKIGDPSGKFKERPRLADEVIAKNVEGIRTNLQTIFDNHLKHFWQPPPQNGGCSDLLAPPKILNNRDWYNDLNIIDFLSTAGRRFRMAKLLSRESVKTRLEATLDKVDPDGGLTFTEFSYQVFQAYDWYHLQNEHGCSIQIGGSDQMGNIATGHDFLDRSLPPDRQSFGILLPLLTSEDGSKMGKTSDSRKPPIWLSPEKTTAFEFYQHFVRLPDSEVERMLYYFTFIPASEIRDLMTFHSKNTEKRRPQTRLAENLTLLVHGATGLSLAQKATDLLYSGESPADASKVCSKLAEFSVQEIGTIFGQGTEGCRSHRLHYEPGLSVLDLAKKLDIFRTEKDALRVVEAGGFYINQIRRSNSDELLIPGNHIIMKSKMSLVRVGKRNYHIVDWDL